MSDNEYVDIVSEEDVVLYQTSKTEAHKKGLLHRTVIAELLNSKGEWTLTRQSSHRQDAGQIANPMGGHVSAGETPEEALKREMGEETGITKFNYRFVGKAIYRRQVNNKDENHYFILFETFSDEKPVISDESVEFLHFSEKELKQAIQNTPQNFGAAFLFIIKIFYPHILD